MIGNLDKHLRRISILCFSVSILLGCENLLVPQTDNVGLFDSLPVYVQFIENEKICQEPGSIRGINRLCFRSGGSNMIYDLTLGSYVSGTVTAGHPLSCRCPENGADMGLSWYYYLAANANSTTGLSLATDRVTGSEQSLSIYSAGEEFSCMPPDCPNTDFYELIQAVP